MKVREKTWALTLLLVFWAHAVSAQDQKQATPPADTSGPIQPLNSESSGGYAKPPAGAGRGVSAPFDSPTYDPSQVTPDQNTLAGAQYLGLGSLEHAHNIFDPAVSFSQLGETSGGTPGQSNLSGVTIIGGSLNFSRNWSRYRLSAIYNGGETIYFGSNTGRYSFQDLSFIQQVDWARWHLILRDDFIASSGAAFTGTGMGGPGLASQSFSTPGFSLSNFGQAFLPSQTIETGNVMRYMNSVLGQAQYSLSRRSTVTFSGSYGLLDFTGGGYISSRTLNAQVGYDYQIDPKNSVAILASYGKIRYPGTADTTTDYRGGLAYGRKITGRMAFQLSLGPEQIRSMNATGNSQLFLLSVNSGLSYAWRRSNASISFTRGLTSGSGVLMGASSDVFSTWASRQFTRFWTGSVSGGFALNNSLPSAGAATARYEDWFFGANLGRQLGRHMQVNFNYGFVRPSSPAVCPVASCGVNGFQQTFGMTLNWHLRPAG